MEKIHGIMKEMTRRDFLRLNASALVTAVLGGCGPSKPTPIVEQTPITEVTRDTLVSVTVGGESFGYYGFSPDLYKDESGNQGFSMGPRDNFFINVWSPGRPGIYRRAADGKIEGPMRRIKFMCNPTVCSLKVEKGLYKIVDPAPSHETYTLRTGDKGVIIDGVLTVFYLDSYGKISTKRYLTESRAASETRFQTNAVQIDGAWRIMPNGQAEKVPDNGGLVVVLAAGKSTGPIAYLHEGYEPEINCANSIK